MPRFHNINGTNVQFTSQEETARDAEEATWAAAADTRAAVRVLCLVHGLLIVQHYAMYQHRVGSLIVLRGLQNLVKG